MNSADTNPLTVLGLAMGFEERGLSAQHEAMLACADHICGFPATLALLKKTAANANIDTQTPATDASPCCLHERP